MAPRRWHDEGQRSDVVSCKRDSRSGIRSRQQTWWRNVTNVENNDLRLRRVMNRAVLQRHIFDEQIQNKQADHQDGADEENPLDPTE